MAAKILQIGLVIGLALALVGGSAYILLRPDGSDGREERSETSAEATGNGRGNGNSREASEVALNGSETEPVAGNGRGNGRGGETSEANGDLEWNGLASEEGTEAVEVESWITLTGVVEAMADGELTLRTVDGAMALELGPERYWETSGIPIEAGDVLVVSGFYEGDAFEVGSIENQSTGQLMMLRDESGRPLWSGGRRGQQ